MNGFQATAIQSPSMAFLSCWHLIFTSQGDDECVGKDASCELSALQRRSLAVRDAEVGVNEESPNLASLLNKG